MSANAIPRPDSNIYEDKTEKSTGERCARLTLKQWFGNLLCEAFQGHEEYLGATPD
jgi:hypothetical protein